MPLPQTSRSSPLLMPSPWLASSLAWTSLLPRSVLLRAEASTNAKFGKLNMNMANQHVDLSDDYGEAACDINIKIAKQAAIQDSYFFPTVVSSSPLKSGTLRPRATE